MIARPFVKWVGGKKQLLNVLEDNLPDDIKFSKKINKYFECFCGGGALYFYLMNNYTIKKSYLCDINSELILTYKVIQNKPKDLIENLNLLEKDYNSKKEQNDKKKYYLNIRKTFNEKVSDNSLFDFSNNSISEEQVKRASYIIFMNKTCFNGLFRLNRKREFNVPHGKYKNPLICDKENILVVSNILKNTTILNTDYYNVIDIIDKNSLVYLDPPYRPLNNNGFTNYDGYEFKDKDQIRLGMFYKEISNKGARIILSNSDPKNTNPEDNFFDNLYSEFNIQRVKAKRSINSNGNGRGKINEILVTNY